MPQYKKVPDYLWCVAKVQECTTRAEVYKLCRELKKGAELGFPKAKSKSAHAWIVKLIKEEESQGATQPAAGSTSTTTTPDGADGDVCL